MAAERRQLLAGFAKGLVVDVAAGGSGGRGPGEVFAGSVGRHYPLGVVCEGLDV